MTCPEYDRFAEFYDHIVSVCRAHRRRLLRCSRPPGRRPVLEVGCGTGRVLIPTARAGVNAVGVDLSAGMLDVCRQKVAAEPVDVQARVELHEDDMRTFDLGMRFPLVTLPFRGFQHLLTVDDQRAALQRLRAHVVDGGQMVLDVFNPSLPLLGDERWLVQPLVEPEFTMPDGPKGGAELPHHRARLRESGPTRRDELRHYHPDGATERRADRFALRYLFRFEADTCSSAKGSTSRRCTATTIAVRTARSTRAS